MTRIWARWATACLAAMLLAGCDDGGDSGDGIDASPGMGGAGGGGMGGAGGGEVPLQPGAAGDGLLAYTVVRDDDFILEVMDLMTATPYSTASVDVDVDGFDLSRMGGRLLWYGTDPEANARFCALTAVVDRDEVSCGQADQVLPMGYLGLDANGTALAELVTAFDGPGLAEVRVFDLLEWTRWPGVDAGEGTVLPFSGAFAPDGQSAWLAVRTTDNGLEVLTVTADGVAATFTFDADVQPTGQVPMDVSADGQRLVMPCLAGAASSTCALDLQANVATVYPAVTDADLSEDGQRIIGATAEGWRFFDFGDAASGSPAPIEGSSAIFSPDAQRLAWRVIDPEGSNWHAPYTAALDGTDVVKVRGNDDTQPRPTAMRWGARP